MQPSHLSTRRAGFHRNLARIVVGASVCVMCLAATVHGGGFNNNNGRAVGGVMIDASGIVRTATVDEKMDLANVMRGVVDQPQGEMAEVAELRMISLRKLQAAISESRKDGAPLPESISFLAGLQRIQYVFVDKENKDIIVAGPAEPWKLMDDGSVVGTQSGGAVLRLEDLVVALQSVEAARTEGITCSIEPTAEGRQRLAKLMRSIKLRPGQSPAVYEESMKQAFGLQTISLTGVPQDSRYARTLIAADYEMKRLAMALAQSPVTELPSYLQMAKNGRQNASQNPRWWMACNYDAMSRSEDKLSWKLTGQGVKTLTEQDVIDNDGKAKRGGRADKIAQSWADKMTENYEQLSRKVSVFGDLRNAMDLSVVATLIVQEELDKRAGLDLSVLSQPNDDIELVSYTLPKAVSPECSFVRGRSGWVVTASGGVDVNAFDIVQNQKTDDTAMTKLRSTALASTDSAAWWWNK
ncbi:DUF1598 domain-containing protein [Stieleria marina]|uniref:DUF1598 domain-containing protein n=1 Tax=Stieleria marina TaxID=1930275 RepID=A0A517NXK6_9BACT|nr:hypothetical protein K239x_38630 [Planctomycetes bacterium K23_9]